MRLSQAARKFNISTETIAQYLNKKDHNVDPTPNTKLTAPQVALLTQEFAKSEEEKKKALQPRVVRKAQPKLSKPDVEPQAQTPKPEITPQAPKNDKKRTPYAPFPTSQTQFRIVGSISLPAKEPKNKFVQVTSSDNPAPPRPPVKKSLKSNRNNRPDAARPFYTRPKKVELKTTAHQKNFKARRKHRKEKKSEILKQQIQAQSEERTTENTLKIAPFITAKELSGLIKKPVADILGTCIELGYPASINQRLNEETTLFLAEHYGYQVEFITIEKENNTLEEATDSTNLTPRAPITTVMGHVDHGKTSLLDSIRKTNLTEKETGGITQHIGAYQVQTPQGKKIVFLDTPGHEAFTAIRARGAQLTDIAIIIVAADEEVMPQTKEAISHAQQAKVPIVVAINKIDKPGANPDRIKGQLVDLGITVEDLGGTHQCQEISAKTGEGIPELLDKILLQAELLALKADHSKEAQGIIIEASLDRGKGYLANVMVQEGTLKKGDIVLAGPYFGKIKAMFNPHGQLITQAPPSTPVQILGMNGAPQAGETFKVIASEKKARELASRYQAIRHQQSLRAKKKVIKTLEDITDPLQGAQQLNIIIKGDVDGSVNALADTILPLSTPDVKVHILHQAVGPISESDVLLAAASQSLIVGFHTTVTSQVKKIADKQKVNIQLHNLIHQATQAIEQLVKDLTKPLTQEVTHGHATIIQIFRVKNIGVVAGCRVKKGVIKRNSKIRISRNQEIIYEGPIKSLKIETEDVKEAKEGNNCGINLRSFDDLQINDNIEAFEIEEV